MSSDGNTRFTVNFELQMEYELQEGQGFDFLNNLGQQLLSEMEELCAKVNLELVDSEVDIDEA